MKTVGGPANKNVSGSSMTAKNLQGLLVDGVVGRTSVVAKKMELGVPGSQYRELGKGKLGM